MVYNRLRALSVALTAAILLAVSATVHAQQPVQWTHGGPLLPDSSNFVTASLLVVSPGTETESAMGHSAIRLECPVHNLDYCFTLENNPEYGKLAFILGKAPAHDIAVPTDIFLRPYKKEGRQIMQYELNLTLREKQELWRAADIEFTNEGHRLFNYSYDGTDNCTSICLEMIEQSLIDEQLVVDEMPPILLENNATYFRHMARRSPWVQFLLITLGGTACDETWNMRNRMSPEMIIPVLSHSHFEGKDNKRLALKGKPIELVTGKVTVTPSVASPLVVFGGLLLLALLVTILQHFAKATKAARVFDFVLFALQVAVALILLTSSCVGSIVGQHWNWYLIPFNLLPLLVWLLWRKHKGFFKVYLFYTIVLVLFILATPLSEQLDLPHQLITTTLAVRCFYNYYNGKRIYEKASVVNNKKSKKRFQTNV